MYVGGVYNQPKPFILRASKYGPSVSASRTGLIAVQDREYRCSMFFENQKDHGQDRKSKNLENESVSAETEMIWVIRWV
jgi:hypothetical protein